MNFWHEYLLQTTIFILISNNTNFVRNVVSSYTNFFNNYSFDQINTLKTILKSLDELGYNVNYEVLNSKNFGVPQNRERVFYCLWLKELNK